MMLVKLIIADLPAILPGDPDGLSRRAVPPGDPAGLSQRIPGRLLERFILQPCHNLTGTID